MEVKIIPFCQERRRHGVVEVKLKNGKKYVCPFCNKEVFYICPKCGDEFSAWVTKCYSCESEKEDENETEAIRKMTEAADEIIKDF